MRDFKQTSQQEYDLIIIGGGIYGVCLALESVRRGLKPLLLEKQEFGGATSRNSLRIIHGGLRYLQSLDLRRFRESAQERKWFLKNFPDLVEPLNCLIPLYNEGLHRTSVFRIALLLNAFFSWNRNQGILESHFLKRGGVIAAKEVSKLFPQAALKSLKGGAEWSDAYMPSSDQTLKEILRWATTLGAVAFNNIEASELIKEGSQVKGLAVRNRESNSPVYFKAPIVINCAGPWSRQIARKMDKDIPKLFKPSLAFNLLLNREPLSEYAVAVTPRNPKGKTYFLRSLDGKLFAGTCHVPIPHGDENPDSPTPTQDQIESFLSDVNRAVPNLNLRRDEVLEIYPGYLPAKEQGSDEIAVREVIYDHGAEGGPQGFYSVSGVKYTTARLVAEKTLKKIYGHSKDLSYRPGTERPLLKVKESLKNPS